MPKYMSQCPKCPKCPNYSIVFNLSSLIIPLHHARYLQAIGSCASTSPRAMPLCHRRFFSIAESHQKARARNPKEEHRRCIRNRIMYNNWNIYCFAQLPGYECLRFGKEPYIIDEHDTTKLCSFLKGRNSLCPTQHTKLPCPGS